MWDISRGIYTNYFVSKKGIANKHYGNTNICTYLVLQMGIMSCHLLVSRSVQNLFNDDNERLG